MRGKFLVRPVVQPLQLDARLPLFWCGKINLLQVLGQLVYFDLGFGELLIEDFCFQKFQTDQICCAVTPLAADEQPIRQADDRLELFDLQ
jgi:hypothetical protein